LFSPMYESLFYCRRVLLVSSAPSHWTTIPSLRKLWQILLRLT
jgi:hypothetical protein